MPDPYVLARSGPVEPPFRVDATNLLADRARRSVVAILGESERPLDAPTISERAPLDASPRLIRDRIRSLERGGIVLAVAGNTNDGTRWALTPAGQELFRLLALMTRIVIHAADLPAAVTIQSRDAVVEQTLRGLADPVVREILRSLAGSSHLSATELEDRCRPTPRRTLYRRLSPLVKSGVVVRTVTGQVPRTTDYALQDRWRPAAAIQLLSSWWGTRHRALAPVTETPDLEGLLMSVLPLTRVTGGHAGGVDWDVDHPDGSLSVRLSVVGGQITLPGPGGHRATPASVSVLGDAAGWAAALVTGRQDVLSVDGDTAFASAVFAAVRGALLSYVR